MPTVSTNGIEMYYERQGAGEPLLLVPGLGLAPLLPARIRCNLVAVLAVAPALAPVMRVSTGLGSLRSGCENDAAERLAALDVFVRRGGI